jgi:MtN3 and saliva related transmembrane protein
MEQKVVMEAIGTLGSVILCGSAVPQILKTYKTRSSQDLSVIYLFVLLTGMIFMEIYSIYLWNWIFIIGNSMSIAMTVVMILFWYRYSESEIVEV